MGSADDGGSTPSIAIGAGSPAIDHVPSGCPPVDGRGFARASGACDAGSFERGASQ